MRRWERIPQVVKAEVTAEMEAIATEIVADMQRLAPNKDGDLAASIGWTWGDAPAGTLAIGSFRGSEYGAMRITIYAGGGDAFYARFQEFGTTKMNANPFFFPVYRAWRPEIRRRIRRAISRGLKKA
ncbi:HK97 gp10 family phage protein [Rhodobacter sp. NTK016B]|nr:HK97 gp10 family phage protein [Rhodobacter sp. NTK016B]